MKKVVSILSLVILTMTILPLSSQAQLRYKLKVGQKYGLKQSTTQDIVQNIQGMSQTIKNTIGGDIGITIKSKDAGVYTSDMVFETLLFKMESTMFSMSYDSTDENQEENVISKAFDAIVGYSFKMKFDELGNIIEVTGFDELAKVIAEKYGSDTNSLNMAQESIKGQFSDESMKQNLRSMLLVYPKEKLSIGTNWSNEVQTQGAMPMLSKYNYKVSALNGSVVEISGTGTMATEEGFSQEQNGMTQHFNLSGSVNLNTSIDAKTGWPKKMTQNQDVEGVVAVESPQLPAPMEIPMTIKSKSTFVAY